MAELGSGTGSGYPGAIDTDTTQEVNSPNAGRTKARAEVINDLNAAVVAVQTELGTDPAGALADVKTYLQTEHGTDGTHLATKVVKLTGNQTAIAGTKAWTGTQKWAKGADVASASALTLGTDGNAFDITGTTTITSIGTLGIGTLVVLQFDGILTLTHHATDLILPTVANITTAAGDIAVFYEYATGDWRCISYSRASGVAFSIADGTVTPTKLSGPTAGDWVIHENNTLRQRWPNTYAKVKEIKVGTAGIYRVRFTIKESGAGSGGAVYGKIYVNGSAVGTERVNDTTTAAVYSEDVTTTAVGDLIQIYSYSSSNTNTVDTQCDISDMVISVAQPFIGGTLYGY